jgi:hypothetical protein
MERGEALRPGRAWLFFFGVLIIGASTQLIMGRRGFGNWLLLASTFSGFMTFLTLRKPGRRRD